MATKTSEKPLDEVEKTLQDSQKDTEQFNQQNSEIIRVNRKHVLFLFRLFFLPAFISCSFKVIIKKIPQSVSRNAVMVFYVKKFTYK